MLSTIEQSRKSLIELVVVSAFGIRNRQVSGSIPLVGSILPPTGYHHKQSTYWIR